MGRRNSAPAGIDETLLMKPKWRSILSIGLFSGRSRLQTGATCCQFTVFAGLGLWAAPIGFGGH